MSTILTAILNQFLQSTAWPMTPPRPYGLFHLCLSAAGSALALGMAVMTARQSAKKAAKKKSHPSPSHQTVLFLCGLLLTVSEIYKQLFLYYIVNNGHYDWWYFPFQLCSVPMYLCLLLPLADRLPVRSLPRTICTFLQDFGLLGGFMALAEPSGLMHPYWTLTLHGFLWHFTLIFIGAYCAAAGISGRGSGSFFSMLPLFFLCCAIATAVDVLSHPYGNADMFYISPYYPNGQIIFHRIALTVGTAAGNVLYLMAVILGGAVVHGLVRSFSTFS